MFRNCQSWSFIMIHGQNYPIDYGYIVRWQADLINTKENILPDCDKPYPKIKENLPHWEEFENMWNYALHPCCRRWHTGQGHITLGCVDHWELNKSCTSTLHVDSRLKFHSNNLRTYIKVVRSTKSTARPKWWLDGPALSDYLLYSLVSHVYANIATTVTSSLIIGQLYFYGAIWLSYYNKYSVKRRVNYLHQRRRAGCW